MKITAIRPIALTAPFLPPRRPPRSPYEGTRNCVWLRLETDAGLVGWGEAYCGCYASEVTLAALRRLGECLIGFEADEPGPALQHLRFWNRYWAMRGVGAQCTSAFEAALWDIAGKARRQPVWGLIGDGACHKVLLYASDGDALLSPEEIYDEAREYVAEGYRAYKMRCGGYPEETGDRLALDCERVAAAREALGPDRLLFVDVGVPQKWKTWTLERAESYLRALAPFAVRFFEEPAMTYDVEGYRRLSSQGLIPIAGGESLSMPEEFQPFFGAGALDVAQPDAAVVGGPASCVSVIRAARKEGIVSCLHAWCAGVGIAQNLNAAAAAGVLAMEWPNMIHPPSTEPIAETWRVEHGYALPEDFSGLGTLITDEFLARYPYRPGCELNY